ncbi:12082_t:CDS:2 [Ambispora gerdemannii]|uniref:Ammonium transporter n=1 Tax=Ambispora gerdemannii TaxID=144530 RepID=A0A9N8VWF8_9GLOM|nr:12082_t:CDS:2 [Ambispora gerdemannii]
MSETQNTRPADVGFVLNSTALVWLMIPGVGYFYSGMARRKNALSLIMLCVLSAAVVSIQWFIFGYSLTFGQDGNAFIGSLKNSFFMGVENIKSTNEKRKIPDMTFAIFQSMFAAITPALAIGSGAERGRILPAIIFIFVWTTLVYDPIAHWVWSPDGWATNSLDFAGGTPVHISSGAAALAYCMLLKKRNKEDQEEFRQHNVTYTVLGTVLMWFGWFGFNGGSALSASPRAVNAVIVTNLSASVGGLTWMIVDYRLEKKFSAIGFCSGAISGLVCITPGAGYVSAPSAVLFGVLGGLMCNLATKLKNVSFLNYDDALDVFAVHGVGGFTGNLLTGIFAQQSIASLDGRTSIRGGWLDRYWMQIVYQIEDSVAGFFYSFCITYLILFTMKKIPVLSIRASSEIERKGIDMTEIGESAYDYIDELVKKNNKTGVTVNMPAHEPRGVEMGGNLGNET